jgi:hypothetical protein
MSVTPSSMTDLLLEVPADLTASMYDPVVARTGSDITTGVGGTGTFDIIMTSMSAYLNAEYAKGRITGADYTKTFIELTQTALSTALQFTLTNDQSFWAAQQSQIAAVTARVALETAKIQHDTAQYQLASILPGQLALTAAQTTGVTAQTALVNTQNSTAAYTLANILPAQLILLSEQMEVQRAQTMGTRIDGSAVAGNMGTQVALYNQQITSYKRDAETKAAKFFSDAYITAKTLDDTITPPTNFTNATIDEVFTLIRSNNGL